MNIETLGKIAEEALVEPVYDNPLFPPSIYYRFLKILAKVHKPATSVVLGVCGGGDCLHLALGWPYGYVVGVDIAYDHPEQIEHIKSVANNFQFWEGDSVESATKIFELNGPIDILFVDTDHTYERTMKEWNAWKSCLSPGAVVIFDDLFRPGMEEAWQEMPGPKIRMDFLHDGTYPHGGGLGVLIHQPDPRATETGYEDRM